MMNGVMSSPPELVTRKGIRKKKRKKRNQPKPVLSSDERNEISIPRHTIASEQTIYPSELFFQPFSSKPTKTLNLRRWLSKIEIGTTLRRCTEMTQGRTRSIMIGDSGNRGADIENSAVMAIASAVNKYMFLTSLDISGCRGLTDPAIQTLARSAAHSLVCLNVSRCILLSDQAFTAIANSGLKLHELRASRLPKLSNLGLTAFLAGPSVPIHLDISYCPRIGTEALVLIGTPRLEYLNLSGLPKLTDDLLGAILKNIASDPHDRPKPPQLKALLLNDNIGLTDEMAREFNTAKTAWGRKRHDALRNLTHIEICNNSNITDIVLERLAVVLPSLTMLSLRECPHCGSALDTLGANLGHCLTELNLSGCQKVDDNALLALAQHGNNARNKRPGLALKSLDLRSCHQISNDGLNALLTVATRLRLVRLDAVPAINIDTFTELARNCTKIRELGLRRLQGLDDKAIIMAIRRCRKLTRIEIAGSTLVTARSVREIGTLKFVNALDISACTNLNDDAMSLLPRTLLVLRAAFLWRLSDEGIRTIAERCPLLKAIDLTGCDQLTEHCVPTLVAGKGASLNPTFPVTSATLARVSRLVRLVLNGCPRINVSALDLYLKSHPFLRIIQSRATDRTDDDENDFDQSYFDGICDPCDLLSATNYCEAHYLVIKQTPSAKERLAQYSTRADRINAHKGALILQQRWRKSRAIKKNYLSQMDRNAAHIASSIAIQRIARGVSARRRAKIYREQVLRIIRFVHSHCIIQRKAKKARSAVSNHKRISRHCQLRRYLHAWRRVEKSKPWSLTPKSLNWRRAILHAEHRLLRRILHALHNLIMAQCGPLGTKSQRAYALWSRRWRRPCFKHWARLITRRVSRRKNMAKIFMIIAHERTYNAETSTLGENAKLAQSHFHRTTLLKIWNPLKLWMTQACPSQLKLTQARKQFYRRRFFRHVPPTFAAMVMYVQLRKKKRERRTIADTAAPRIRSMAALGRLRRFALERKFTRNANMKGVHHLQEIVQKKVLISLNARRILSRRTRQSDKIAHEHYTMRLIMVLHTVAWPRLLHYREVATARQRTKGAFTQLSLRSTASRIHQNLATFRLGAIALRAERNAHRMLMYTSIEGIMTVAAAAMISSSAAALEAREHSMATERSYNRYRARGQDDILKQLVPSPDHYESGLCAAECILRYSRGFLGRHAAVRYRADRDFSVLYMQRCVRRWLAYRKKNQLLRHRHVRELVTAEGVRAAMEIEEKEMRTFMREEARWKRVEGLIRRYIARQRATKIRWENARQANAEFLASRHEDIRRRVHLQRERKATEYKKRLSVVTIQRRFRGMLGRRRFQNKLQIRYESVAALIVQTAFRRARGRRQAAARRRAAAATKNFLINRQRQGLILRRYFGRRRQRRTQRPLLKATVPLGLDPMSFTLSPLAQLDDLRTDAISLLSDLRIEIGAFRKAGFNAYARAIARAELQTEANEKHQLLAGDAVRVIDPKHERRGETAYLTAIDLSVPERIVADLIYDKDNAYESMPMISKGDMFSGPIQTLAKIPKLDRPLPDFLQPRALRKNSRAILAYAKKERPIFMTKYAAIKIQRHVRRYLAIRNVAQKRYNFWRDSHTNRRIILSTLAATGSMHIGAVETLLRLQLGLRIEHFQSDLPGWESSDLSHYSAPPPFALALRQKLHTRNTKRELAWRTKLRQNRVKALRKGARPNNAVLSVLLGKPRKSSLATVHEDRAADLRRWERFVRAAPVARVWRKVDDTFFMRDIRLLQNTLYRYVNGSIADGFNRIGWLRSAYFFYGADALLSYAHRKVQYMKEIEQADENLDQLADQLTKAGGWAPQQPTGGSRRLSRIFPSNYNEDLYEIEAQNEAKAALPEDSWLDIANAQRVWVSHINISEQFALSPHLRVHDIALYHGAWSGHPTTKILSRRAFWPEGEGFLEFLDGYGCAQEEKTLRVTVIKCQDLRAADVLASDPYIKLECNDRTFRTEVKRNTLNPTYDETFEVDVTDPKANIHISIYDWDRFSRDDWLGDCSIQIGAIPFSGRRPYRAWFYLGDYRPYHPIWRRSHPFEREQVHDRGQIELEFQWTEKPRVEEFELRRLRRRNAIRLQSWIRARQGRKQCTLRKQNKQEAFRLIHLGATKIQGVWRAMRSRYLAKLMRVQRHAAVRLQALFRRRLAWDVLQDLRLEYHMATKLQVVARRYLVAPALAARFRLVQWIDQNFAAIVIEGFVRVIQAKRKAKQQRGIRRRQSDSGSIEDHGVALEVLQRLPAHFIGFRLHWLAWYGRDFLYRTKRLRRIATKAAKRMLALPGTRIRTTYGPAIVVQFPAPALESPDAAAEKPSATSNNNCSQMSTVSAEGTLRRPRFVLVLLLGCREPLDAQPPLLTTERASMLRKAPRHAAVIRLGSFLSKESIIDRVIMLQCKFRFDAACRRVSSLLKRDSAARIIQRVMRDRRRYLDTIMTKIQKRARIWLARQLAERLRREIVCAIRVQTVYRRRIGLRKIEDKRLVPGCQAALVSSEYDVSFTADKTLDGQLTSYWMSREGAAGKQWIVYDMIEPTCIGIIELLVPDNTTAPRHIAVDVSDHVRKRFKRCFSIELPPPRSVTKIANVLKQQVNVDHEKYSRGSRGVRIQRRQDRGFVWWRMHIPFALFKVKRYWRLAMIKNWSSTEAISLSGIRWLVAKEYSPIIDKQPKSVIVQPGPHVGANTPKIKLAVRATSWPLPQFQWLRNGIPVPGANRPVLELQSRIPRATQVKKFRCVHCRKVNRDLPVNIYRNKCLNCHTIFNWPEQEQAAVVRHDVTHRMGTIESEIVSLDRRIEHTQEDITVLNMQVRLAVGKRAVEASKATSTESPLDSTAGTDGKARPEAEYSTQKKNASASGELSTNVLLSEEPLVVAKRQRILSLMTPERRIPVLERMLRELRNEKEKRQAEREGLTFSFLAIKESGQDSVKLDYDCEGIYTCRVTNLRAKHFLRFTMSKKVAIYIGDPPPLPTKVVMDYAPRPHGRRKYYDQYASLQGFVRRGFVSGDVVIKYHSGDTYCGPLVAERWLDQMGNSRPEGRDKDHWGLWRRNDGTIYEGATVDNHFDVENIQGEFRVTYPATRLYNDGDLTEMLPNEQYDGCLVDGERHGLGKYEYFDGSIYVGEWHLGERQGFGRLTSPDKTYFEGDWDRNRIHGSGTWHWPDGSSYTGDVWDGVRRGKGVYISSKQDIYVGEFEDNQMHGHGILSYHDGSRFEGIFVMNQREGLGTFTDVDGVKFMGSYLGGQRHGEFLIRRPVYTGEEIDSIPAEFDSTNQHGKDSIEDVEEAEADGLYEAAAANAQGKLCMTEEDDDDDNGEAGRNRDQEIRHDEIQQGFWERGIFVKWLTPPINPLATLQFCRLFEQCDEEYDGVYALMIARRLPLLPYGVQPDHPRVVPIVDRIRREGGSLVARDTYAETKLKLLEAEPIVEETSARMRAARDEIARHAEFVKETQRVVEQAEMQLRSLNKKRSRLEAQVEKFWDDDPLCRRREFLEAVAAIQKIEVRDFFVIRYFPTPPPLLEKVMRATCATLGEPETWKSAQLLLGSAQQNADAGDQEALTNDYEIKLQHKLAKYDVWTYANNKELQNRIAGIMIDRRFKPDHHHVKSYGLVPPALITFVLRAHSYVQRTAAIKPVKEELDDVINKIVNAELRRDEANKAEIEAKDRHEQKSFELQATENEGRRALREVERLRLLILECENMIEEYQSDTEEAADDYYKSLDDVKRQETRHEVEITLSVMCDHVQKKLTEPEPGSEEWLRVRGLLLALMGGLRGATSDMRAAAKIQAEEATQVWFQQESQRKADKAVEAAFSKMPPPGEAFHIAEFAQHAASRARAELLETLPHYYSGGKMYFGAPTGTRTILNPHDGHGEDRYERAERGQELCENAIDETVKLVRKAILQSSLRLDDGTEHIIVLPDKRVDLKFVSTLVSHEWECASVRATRIAACTSWITAFPHPLDPETCEVLAVRDMDEALFYDSPEYMAISARVNWVMTDEARAEAAVWERDPANRERVIEAEYRIVEGFEAEHEPTELGAARAAISIRDERDYGVDAVAAATVWCKFNPSRVHEAILDDEYDMAVDFEEKYEEDTALKAARVLSGVSAMGFGDENSDGSEDRKAATAWAANNVEAYAEVQETAGDELAAKFAEHFADVQDDSSSDEDSDIDEESAAELHTAKFAVRTELDPTTPEHFRAAGRAWKGRHRHAYDRALQKIMTKQDQEDIRKVKEISRLENHIQEKHRITRQRIESRNERLGGSKSSAVSSKLETENAADANTLREHLEEYEPAIVELLRWRYNTHYWRLERIESELTHLRADRTYLVCLRNVKPSIRERLLREQRLDYEIKVDSFEAAHAAKAALLANIKSRLDEYEHKDRVLDLHYDAEGYPYYFDENGDAAYYQPDEDEQQEITSE